MLRNLKIYLSCTLLNKVLKQYFKSERNKGRKKEKPRQWDESKKAIYPWGDEI